MMVWIVLKVRFLAFKRRVRYFLRSPLRLWGMVIFLSSIFWGIFFLVRGGFNFLNRLGGLGTVIFNKLFYVFFLSLGGMLAISSGILFYICSFRSKDTFFLLQSPLDIKTLSLNKFFEVSVLSSWGFAFGIFPFIFAYGSLEKVGFSYYVISLLYIIPFALLSCLLGAVLCMAVIRFWRSYGFRCLVFLSVGLGLVLLLRPKDSNIVPSGLFLSRFGPLFKISSFPYSFHFWVSQGLKNWQEGFLLEAVLYLSCLASTLAIGWIFLGYISQRWFYSCFQAVNFEGRSKKKASSKALDRFFFRYLRPRWLCAFILKDIKNFRRDPLQWSQFLVFFGILFIYVANLRNFSYHLMGPIWKNLITFLNVFAVGGVLSSLSTRYIYPQLSLEGLSFWILGLSPVSLKKIMLQKLFISLFASIIVCESIMVVSGLNTQIEPLLFFSSIALVFILCIGVVSICLGLGAYFADFTKTHHLEVISEFGGILTLVFNLLYLIPSVLGLGVIFHLNTLGRVNIDIQGSVFSYLSVLFFITLAISGGFLHLGLKALESKEF